MSYRGHLPAPCLELNRDDLHMRNVGEYTRRDEGLSDELTGVRYLVLGAQNGGAERGRGVLGSGRRDRLHALRAPTGVRMLTPCQDAPSSQVYQPSMGPRACYEPH
jgi:hypothetical protein